MKFTIFQIKLAFYQQNRKKIVKKHTLYLLWHILVFTSVLHKMTWLGHAHSSQFMEWQNLGITILKHATCTQMFFFKSPESQITTDIIYLISSNFVIISHINYWHQVNSWKNWWKFSNGPEINEVPSPYSMLQHIGRVATPKLMPRTCLTYLQTTLIIGGGRLVLEFMSGITGTFQRLGWLKPWGHHSEKFVSATHRPMLDWKSFFAYKTLCYLQSETIKVTVLQN